MKKSVLFLILIIAILSIFVVSFFGTKAKFDKFKVYIDEVEITSFDFQFDGEKYIHLTLNEEIGEVSKFIDYRVGPKNATEKSKIEFTFVDTNVYKDEENEMFVLYEELEDGERETIATLNKMGEITFYREGAVLVQLASKDGLERSDLVFVYCDTEEK